MDWLSVYQRHLNPIVHLDTAYFTLAETVMFIQSDDLPRSTFECRDRLWNQVTQYL